MYARHASAEFNARLHAALQRLTADVRRALRDNLVALVLGGGYGRGEGGVVGIGGEERPYNDLDLVLVVRRKNALPAAALAAIGQAHGAELGIEVDFSRPLTLGDIRRWPHRLMWFDLLHGHLVLCGPQDLLRTCTPQRLREPLPAIEATRLLLNRGAGLLWALRLTRGLEPPPDPDFARRNYYKCALALGDALLIVHRRFTSSYRRRDALLAGLEADCAGVAELGVGPLYRRALRFKFRPDALPGEVPDEARLRALAEGWGQVFLYVERLRTRRRWPSLAAYARWQGVREPDQNTPLQWPRNVVWNRRLGVWSWRYPRERLYRRLPILLGLTRIPVMDWPAETARLLALWQRFN